MATLTVLREAISPDNLLSLIQNIGHVNADNQLGTSLRGKHGKNTSTAANVKNHLVLEEVGVLHNGVAVGECSDRVLEHLFVDTWIDYQLCRYMKDTKSNLPKWA